MLVSTMAKDESRSSSTAGAGTGAAVIRDPEQIRALRSPLRQEILDKAQALGPCSIGDLARALGRPADGLYYHLRALLAVGLLRPAGQRGEGRRREALYETPAPEGGLWLAYEPADPANAAAITAAVGGMLRLTERSFAAGFRPDSTCAGPCRNLWAARSEGWLSADDLREVNALLHRLREVLARGPAEGRRLHALTFVLTPVETAGSRRAPAGRTPRRRGTAR
jgi:DNA-binding transcriptional ArsR family regulator